MPEPSSSVTPSTLTQAEIAVALAKARELEVSVIEPEGANPEHLVHRPVREMEIAQILETVYDQRLSGATQHIQQEIERLASERDRLQAALGEMEDERAELEASRRVRRAWAKLRPQIQNTDWYEAAMAVRDLDAEEDIW